MVAGGAGVLLNVEHRNKQWELTCWSRNRRKYISGWNGATQVTFELSAVHSIDDVLCHEHLFQHWRGRLSATCLFSAGAGKHSAVCQRLGKHVNNLCDSLHVNKCYDFGWSIDMRGPADVGEDATSYLWADMEKNRSSPQDDNYTMNDVSLWKVPETWLLLMVIIWLIKATQELVSFTARGGRKKKSRVKRKIKWVLFFYT